MPLQDLMNDGSMFSEVARQMPFPLILYNRDGVVEMANAIFLKETELSDDDVKNGKVSIMKTEHEELLEALMMVFRRNTAIVNGLDQPLDDFCPSGSHANPGSYKCAVVFPYYGDIPILYGIAVFFPMEI